ncbi:MAG: tetratricopeptide repeat protein [Vicinamibacterales bacterium]
MEALNGVLALDSGSGRAKDAVARADAALARQTPTVELLTLAARAHAVAGDLNGAERLLRQAIEQDPDRLQGYALLGQLYARQNRLGDAVGRFQEVVKRNPKSVAAYTMIGVLQEMQGKPLDAEQTYKQILSIDPRAGVASNNLAYIYVSSDRNVDQALTLAQTAKEQLPDEPHVSDTLGWIYVKKNMLSSAIPHLETSASKTPDDPLAQFHLGMAYKQSGDFDKAKKALSRALALRSDFEGAAEARKALADIGA